MNETVWNLRLAAETGNRNRQQSSERINSPKMANCSRNYLDLNREDFPRELANHTGTFEPLPIHCAPLNVRQFRHRCN